MKGREQKTNQGGPSFLSSHCCPAAVEIAEISQETPGPFSALRLTSSHHGAQQNDSRHLGMTISHISMICDALRYYTTPPSQISNQNQRFKSSTVSAPPPHIFHVPSLHNTSVTEKAKLLRDESSEKSDHVAGLIKRGTRPVKSSTLSTIQFTIERIGICRHNSDMQAGCVLPALAPAAEGNVEPNWPQFRKSGL